MTLGGGKSENTNNSLVLHGKLTLLGGGEHFAFKLQN